MSSVTKSGNSFIYKHTYSNGVVMTVKFGADQASDMSCSDWKKFKELSVEERMKADDNLALEKVKAIKTNSKSDFIIRHAVAVQGGLGEVVDQGSDR